MRSKMNRKKWILVVCLCSVTFCTIALALMVRQRFRIKAGVKQSARDLLVLRAAMDLKSNWMGGAPTFPDYTFQSPEMRMGIQR